MRWRDLRTRGSRSWQALSHLHKLMRRRTSGGRQRPASLMQALRASPAVPQGPPPCSRPLPPAQCRCMHVDEVPSPALRCVLDVNQLTGT